MVINRFFRPGLDGRCVSHQGADAEFSNPPNRPNSLKNVPKHVLRVGRTLPFQSSTVAIFNEPTTLRLFSLSHHEAFRCWVSPYSVTTCNFPDVAGCNAIRVGRAIAFTET